MHYKFQELILSWKLSNLTQTSVLYTPAKKQQRMFRQGKQKLPLVNQQCVVLNYFKWDLCDTDYVSYTCRHLDHQRVEEHKRSDIGNRMKQKHYKTAVY